MTVYTLMPFPETAAELYKNKIEKPAAWKKPGTVDLTGHRFGMLTAIEPTEKRVRGRVVWRCRCDCGGEVDAPTDQLKSGYRKSCGCLSRPPLKDFIGQRFGRLIVTEYAGKRSGMHRWRCLCDCGNETLVGQTLLQSGKTQSCGCLNSERLVEGRRLTEGTSISTLEYFKNHLSHSNKSGCNGVYRHNKTGKWVAQLTFKGKTKYLGIFANKEDAIKARRKAEAEIDDFIENYYRLNPERQRYGETESIILCNQ